MIKTTILLGFICFLFSVQSYGQSKNFKFCKEVITRNDAYAVKSSFTLTFELSPTQIENLKTSIYKKSSIYFVKINDKNNGVEIYHLSDIHYEDIKLLVEDLNIELNFLSTTPIEFKDESINNESLEIER